MNDFDRHACAWLRELVAQWHLPPGTVLEKSIHDIEPSELDGHTHVHLFAGIGGWPIALRMAGWPDDRPVWTGSCPCQPFSSAGKRRGVADERHLWPAFHRLIAERRPATVFGEQVASRDGREWLAGVRADLEALGYAVGAADLCAAGVGAPHIRQRLYWGASLELPDGDRSRGIVAAFGRAPEAAGTSVAGRLADAELQRTGIGVAGIEGQSRLWRDRPAIDGAAGDVGHRFGARLEEHARHGDDGGESRRLDSIEGGSASEAGVAGDLADADGTRHRRIAWQGVRATVHGYRAPAEHPFGDGTAGHMEHSASHGRLQRWAEPGGGSVVGGCGDGHWSDHDIVWCRDPRGGPNIPRRIEPGTFPLAHGVHGRVGLLRGYGNAIVPQVAAKFVKAFVEAIE